MILNNAVNAGGFIYCMASFTPWEYNEYHNIGDGHYHQWCYIINGWGKSELKDLDGNVLRTVEEKTRPNDLIDLTPTKDLLHCTTVFESPLSMILFNPIPDTRNIRVEIVKNGTLASPAIARARRVLPVPGDPTNRQPLGILPPSF